ncbi:MAG: AAA family ATPase [Gammaproteobacteria bacterium]|nr:AAA family ATPase [Gammaproteobacteria bacterium]
MYEDFFGLDSNPFRLSPDPDCFFRSAIHAKALAYLRYGIMQHEGFIVITGEIGSGKTVLIRNVIKQIDHERHLVAFIPPAILKDEDVIRAVAVAFDVYEHGLGKVDLALRLQRLFADLVWHDRTAILVIDEAQTLSREAIEELMVLANVMVNDVPVLQVILVGQALLKARLSGIEMEQIRQRVVAYFHLTPLMAEEVCQYIDFRMRRHGWNGQKLFTSEVSMLIYAETSGLPRRINRMCDRILLNCFLQGKKEVTAVEVVEVIGELKGEMIFDPEEQLGDKEDPLLERVSVMEGRVRSMEKVNTLVVRMLRKMVDRNKISA